MTSVRPSISVTSYKSTLSQCKLVIIGNPGVGKTSIITQYINHSFMYNYIPTIGLGYTRQVIKYPHINHHILTMEIWDTSSHDSAREINDQIASEANIILMVYDCTKKDSFEYIKKYYQGLEIGDGLHVAVAGNKSDREEEIEVSKIQGKEFAKNINAIFQTISAKTSNNIQNLFYGIGVKWLKPHEPYEYYDTEMEKNDKEMNKISRNISLTSTMIDTKPNKDGCIIY